MSNEFDGSRYDSSGGYEIVSQDQIDDTWKDTHNSLVNKSKDELEKFLSEKEKELIDIQSQKDKEFRPHNWKLITCKKRISSLETTYVFWCSECGSVKLMSSSESKYWHLDPDICDDESC